MLRVCCPRHSDDCVRGALHACPGWGLFFLTFLGNIIFSPGCDQVPDGGVAAAALAGRHHDHQDVKGAGAPHRG